MQSPCMISFGAHGSVAHGDDLGCTAGHATAEDDSSGLNETFEHRVVDTSR